MCIICSDASAPVLVQLYLQVNGAKQLSTKLQEAGKSLVPLLEGNLVDKVWGEGRPAAPHAPIRIHKMEHAGESVQDKLARMREEMTGQILLCFFY